MDLSKFAEQVKKDKIAGNRIDYFTADYIVFNIIQEHGMEKYIDKIAEAIAVVAANVKEVNNG